MTKPDRQILDVSDVQDRLRRFASERDWEKFHTPKNLAMSESGELLELFQWLTPEESATVGDDDQAKAVADELADIVQYAVRLADVLEIDLPAALTRKLDENEIRYPATEVKGLAVKKPHARD